MLNYYAISNALKIKNKIEWSNVRKGYQCRTELLDNPHSVRHQKLKNLYSALIEFNWIFETHIVHGKYEIMLNFSQIWRSASDFSKHWHRNRG